MTPAQYDQYVAGLPGPRPAMDRRRWDPRPLAPFQAVCGHSSVGGFECRLPAGHAETFHSWPTGGKYWDEAGVAILLPRGAMDEVQLERLGRIADHLGDSSLRALYVEITGQDPWEPVRS